MSFPNLAASRGHFHPVAKAAAERYRSYVHRHPEEPSEARRLEGWRPRPGRRPPISGLPEIGTIARKSATADLRWLASLAPQGDGLSQCSMPLRSQLTATGPIRS